MQPTCLQRLLIIVIAEEWNSFINILIYLSPIHVHSSTSSFRYSLLNKC